MEKTETNSVTDKVIKLMGIDPQRYFDRWHHSEVTEIVALKHTLALSRHCAESSPLSEVLVKAGADIFNGADTPRRNVSVEIIDGYSLTVDFMTADTAVFVMPARKDTQRIMPVIYSLLRRQSGDKLSTCATVMFDPRRRKFSSLPLAYPDGDKCQDIYDAFVTAVCTNEELDFDIELEICELRSRSRANRNRIKQRMKQLGVKVLRGKKADVRLCSRKYKAVLDIDLLRQKYPDVYRQCTVEADPSDYITVKLHQ